MTQSLRQSTGLENVAKTEERLDLALLTFDWPRRSLAWAQTYIIQVNLT